MALALRLGVSLRAKAGATSPAPLPALPFDPSALFASGEAGFLYDFSRPDTLFQGTAGTTPVASDGDFVGRVKSVAANEVDAIQAASAARPTWKGDFLRFFGSDDCLVTPLVPSPSFTMAIRFMQSAGSNSSVLMGARSSSSTNAWIGLGSGGRLGAGVGTRNNTSLVDPTQANFNGVVSFGAVSWTPSSVKLYRDGILVDEEVPAGEPTASVPIAIGALNAGGTPSFFAPADIYNALAINRELTASEIEALASHWGTP